MAKVAVVTGGGSGVGRAVALQLRAQGWRLALIGRRAEPLRQTRGNKTRAAEVLSVWRPRLLRRLEHLGLANAADEEKE